MRLSLIFWILLLPLFSVSQKTKTDYEYYETGQIYWKGELILHGNAYSPVGLWQYWHEDGKLKLETWDDTNSRTKYINMWLPTGEQILKNGNGFMYEVWPGGDQEADSTVYEVKDSIKQGSVKVYRLYKGGNYFFVMGGQYDQNSEKTGKWTFRDSINGYAFECYYLNDKMDGFYKGFYLNGALRDSGQYKNDYEDGEWKYFAVNGRIAKECNYKAGKLIGKYKEYYHNGKIKVKGAYRQAEGIIKVGARAADSGKSRIYDKKIPNKEYKTGKWIYYDKKGNVMKTEQYK